MTDPPALFPRLGPATTAALFHGVEGVPAPPTDAAPWSEDLHTIVHERLSGLALAAARQARSTLDPGTERRLVTARDEDVARSLALTAGAPAVLEELGRADIPAVVTKGPGIASVYPHPSLRPFCDIDLLVPPARFLEAGRALGRMGFIEPDHVRAPRGYFSRRCWEGVNLLRGDGMAVDLHHHVPPWVWGRRIPFDELLARSRLTEEGIRVLEPAHNLLVAGLHVLSDKRRPGRGLIIWRDLVSLTAVCDPEHLRHVAGRLGLDWLLALVLGALPEFTRPRHLLERFDTGRGPVDAFRIRRLLPPALGSRHQVAWLFRLPLPNALAFLAGYLAPSRAFLRGRYGSTWSYARWWGDAFGRLRAARIEP